MKAPRPSSIPHIRFIQAACLALAFALTGGLSHAQPPVDSVVVQLPTWPRSVTTSIVLGSSAYPAGIVAWPSTPPAPVNVTPGDSLHLSAPFSAAEITSITWYKNNVRLPAATTITLDFAPAYSTDSGIYYAVVSRTTGEMWASDPLTLRVVPPVRQQLLNLSSRTTISPANPTLIAGFVVAAPAGTLNETKSLLIRAVGPTLATMGVPRALAAPHLALFRADGSQVEFPNVGIPESVTPDQVATRVGAFPIGANDQAVLIDLPAGVYTAHVTSADGGNGDALLEIYEVPDSALDWLSYWPSTHASTRPATLPTD